MIKKFNLVFHTLEMEASFAEWSFPFVRTRYEVTLILLMIFLICEIILFNSLNLLAPLISSCIALSIQPILFFFMRKYQHKIDSIMTCNQIVFAIQCEILRLYFTDSNLQWQLGFQFCFIRFYIYWQHQSFLGSTFVYIISFTTSLIMQTEYSVIMIITYFEIMVASIAVKYLIDWRSREYYLASKHYLQYENIIEELLPAWVVLIKYDKYQAQLVIDKANSYLKKTLLITENVAFRQFLRDLVIYSEQPVKLEHDLIRLLQTRSSETQETKIFYGESKTTGKKRLFKISLVYFNTLEPTVLLLFEELTEDKYESLQQQILWRDQQAIHNAKLNMKTISQFVAFMKQLRTVSKQFFQNKVSLLNYVQLNCNRSIIQGYNMFNQALNILTLTKINVNQIKYEINSIMIQELLTQLKDDLHFGIDQKAKLNVARLDTDKSKLISIIISIQEFIRILISIQNNDEESLNSLEPMGHKIRIKFKHSKQYEDSIDITLSHPKFIIQEELQDKINENTLGADHKKCNWGVSHYFENVKVLSQQIQNMLDGNNGSQSINHRFPSLDQISENISSSMQKIPSQQRMVICERQENYSTLGLPLAQYLISQIGPSNKLYFRGTNLNSCQNPIDQHGKIKFIIYQDLNKFIAELNHHQPHPLFDLYVPQKSPRRQTLNKRTDVKKPSLFYLNSPKKKFT